MLVVRTDINIQGFGFRYVQETETTSSWELLTDTCDITIPRNIKWGGSALVKGERLLKRGQPVTIKHGYGNVGDEDTIFQGYIERIHPGQPLKISCQDEMFKLKGQPVTASYKSISLRQLLTNHMPAGIPFECPDVELGQFRITNASVAQVLEELRKTYRLHSWFRNGTLYSGLAYWPDMGATHTFTIGHDVVDFADLTWWQAGEIKLKVKGISMLPDNTKLEYEEGDTDGEQRTFHYYNLTLEELKARVADELANLKIEGFTGSFTAFGQPYVQHGDVINLNDPRGMVGYSGGSYLVRKVVYTGGVNGLRQRIYLDGQIRTT